jgi:hypothetical protein
MKIKVKEETPRTDLFLRGIMMTTKQKLQKLKDEGKYRTFSALIDAIFKDN